MGKALKGGQATDSREPASRVDHHGMVIDMNEAQGRTVDQVSEMVAEIQELQLRPLAVERGALRMDRASAQTT